MTYQWDNKKPTALMLGRWQPFHDGHYTLFKEIIKKQDKYVFKLEMYKVLMITHLILKLSKKILRKNLIQSLRAGLKLCLSLILQIFVMEEALDIKLKK